jgi:hypothetical protein
MHACKDASFEIKQSYSFIELGDSEPEQRDTHILNLCLVPPNT